MTNNNSEIQTTGNGPKPVAVVILNWNGEKLLRRFLPSVIAHTPAAIADIIVADNGSTDQSLELLRNEFPQVKVMAFDENYGFAEGYNRALAQVKSPFSVLLNSDVEVKDDWLTPLYRFMNEHNDYGACQPVIRALNNPSHFEYAGAAGGFLDKFGYPYCRGRLFGVTEADTGQYATSEATDIFWASGAALMTRTRLYVETGGLDSKFFAHMEEIDLCWRIHLAGRKIACVNTARVYHLGGGSLPAENPRKTYLNFRNNLLMLHKNLPDSVRGSMLFKRRLLDTVAWLKFVVSFDFKNAKAIVNAHNDFRTMRRGYDSHPQVNLLGSTAQSRVNIIVEHFLKGKKKYSEIKFYD